MHTHPQYHDLVGSEGPDYSPGYLEQLEQHETLSASWYNHADVAYIDPYLHLSPTYNTYPSTPFTKALDSRRPCTSYDVDAHGFNPLFLRMNSNTTLPQRGLFDPEHDPDQYRHLRHYSPTDPLGFTLSSNTDSSISDYALSPDVARNPQDHAFTYTSQGVYNTPMATPQVTAPAWHPTSSLMPVRPPLPVLSQHTVPSMRHLQVTPDPEPEHEDVPMDERDAFQPRINLPEELAITEQVVSPPDSGTDRGAGDDETIKDEEEDSAAVESDSDSEFNPKAKALRSSTLKRHSLREPRRPRSTLDPKARITKTSHAREAFHNSNSRAKSKKKPPVTKKTDSDSKSFPCAFHHFGCCATFANKNEWKRHVSSQHLQLGYYRCDMDACADHQKGFNDFNRKDLFTQHCRRMHAPWSGTRRGEDGVSKREKDSFERQLDIIRTRCWVDRRKAPHKTKCGFCGQKFVDGKDSKGWDERMEHVGRHFERDGAKSEDEAMDDGLKQWAVNEGLVFEGKKKGEFWLLGFEPAGTSRGVKGQRRSKRFVMEEEARENEEDSEKDNSDIPQEDDGTRDDDEHESIEVKGRGILSNTEKTSGDEDAEPDSDLDAEAEYDE
ncbi:hypothetical protein G647_03007 [Cladophialophora carrionii CBS 160.54]|uniref:C2H2-type domain-containing protein n=1 Tax=Cladophialophora carrionii CBS 160.54 TaxID=1279043 RepID=V9DH96_9EURO|nr:uncharacterized protein G647_03007 [Cladophialophora carrionii CBS 160.54]ETI26230.1 hypothetical protein G647_03007 [Cladophialophora carrionii CBS 160.54]